MFRPTEISASAPTVNEDFDAGYRPGNLWFDTSTNVMYICDDDANGAASWTVISSGDVGSWADWTPTLSWTGNTPTGVTTVARYLAIGDMRFFTIDISCTTGGVGDLTGLEISNLPGGVADNNNEIPVSSYYKSGASYSDDNIAYIDGDGGEKIAHHDFPTVGTTTAFEIYFRGFYEYDSVAP